ncbi:hypothetical protein Pcinc_021351 [Petrolisthes cinctipes]|uniref:Uncharacterized protein n=1 Tax=Petrolisthes cinctipes TaxID=88211 RepID=A0AAE1FHE6_PETCI|nr:hypothetical protein Pcinc_021351 [Petrolisthes cinctipes]
MSGRICLSSTLVIHHLSPTQLHSPTSLHPHICHPLLSTHPPTPVIHLPLSLTHYSPSTRPLTYLLLSTHSIHPFPVTHFFPSTRPISISLFPRPPVIYPSPVSHPSTHFFHPPLLIIRFTPLSSHPSVTLTPIHKNTSCHQFYIVMTRQESIPSKITHLDLVVVSVFVGETNL